MVDANFIQKKMQEIQNNEEFASAFGQLISGRAGYKPVIEKKYVPIVCKNCGTILDESEKFCHECGTKAEKPEKK